MVTEQIPSKLRVKSLLGTAALEVLNFDHQGGVVVVV